MGETERILRDLWEGGWVPTMNYGPVYGPQGVKFKWVVDIQKHDPSRGLVAVTGPKFPGIDESLIVAVEHAIQARDWHLEMDKDDA